MDLGELVGSLRLEDSQFGQVLSGALDKLGGFAGKGLKIASAAGAAIAVGLTASLVQNMSMDAANDKLAAQLGLTAAESEKAGKIAGSLYAGAYGESLEQVNAAVGAVMSSIDGMADASATEIEGATAKVLDFAAAFEVDVTRAAQVAGQMITTGLAGDANEAFDLLVAGSQRVPAALREDLLDAVDEYGQFFSTLGYTGEQAFAVLVEGSAKGMYGIDKAGDAIKEFTIRATDMSTSSQEAYAAIGLSAEGMSNKLLAGGDTASEATQKIIGGLLEMKDPAAQAQAAIALFGTPLEDLNAAEIPAFLQSLQGGSDAMDGFGGAADRMGTTLNDNASTALTSLKRQAELAFISLSNDALPIIDAFTSTLADEFGPALSSVGGFITDTVVPALEDLAGWMGENETLVKSLASVITGVLVAALAVWASRATSAAITNTIAWFSTAAASSTSATIQQKSALQVVVGWLIMGATATAQAVRMAAAWLLGVVTGAARSTASMAVAVAAWVAGWVVMGAQAMAQAARMAAAWLIALGPIGIAIAAIVAVVVLIIKYWDEIKAATKAAWDWVVEQVKKVPGAIVNFFMNWTLPGLIIKHWDRIKSTFRNGVSSVVQWMRELPGRILGAIGNLGSLLWGVGEDIMRGLRDGIDRGLEWVKSKLGGVGKLIPGWLKDVLGISSPSKVMRDQVGLWIPAGVAEGVEAGARRYLHPALDRMAESVSRPLTAAAAYEADVTSLTRAGNRVDMSAPRGPFDRAYGGPLVEQHVHAAPGMDEETIGRAAGERVLFGMETVGMPT